MNEDIPTPPTASPEATQPTETPPSLSAETTKATPFGCKACEYLNKVDVGFAKVLGIFENHPWEAWLAAANRFFDKILPFVIAAAGVLAFLTGLVMTLKKDYMSFPFVVDIAILVGTLFAIHLVPKTLALPRSFLANREPDAMRPELLHILKTVLGLGGLIVAIVLILQFEVEPLIFGLIVAIVSFIHLIVFSHPAIIGAKADYPTNIVEEFIGILLVPLKILLSLLTIFVGLASVLLFVIGLIQIFDNGGDATLSFLFSAFAPLAIPITVYVVYLFTVFLLDLYRAIVCLPRKLDGLRKIDAEK